MTTPVVALHDVSKGFRVGRFPSRIVEAVRGVSIEVRPGDIYGFLGPNGSGKTTTVRCILGLTRPSAGQIVRFGNEQYDPVQFFQRTAYCPEESHFPMYATARELLVHWARMYGQSKNTAQERAQGALETVGLLENGDRRIGTYSKGMKQRVGIAGCLLSDPDLVIMDEPARGLDPLARHLIRNIISDLAKQGKTIFMNSHILSEVERVCTRIAIIHRGKLKRQLNMSDLVREKSIEVLFRPGASGPQSDREDGKGKIILEDTAALADFATQLAQGGGEIISVNKDRVDLEKYFIKVVGDGGE